MVRACTYTLTLPPEYGYVILTVVLGTLVAQWHSVYIYKSRKAAKDAHPNAYPLDAEAKESTEISFLCKSITRSQASVLEHQHTILASLLLYGLMYPILSAGLGLGWCGARVAYALGYVNKDKIGKGRTIGNYLWGAEFAFQMFAIQFGYRVLRGCP